MMFRICVQKDLAEIVVLFNQAKRHMVRQGIYQWTSEYPNEKLIKEDIHEKRLYKLVENDKIVNVVTLEINQAEKLAWMKRFVTIPEKESTGLASVMLENIYRMMKERKLSFLYASTNHTNKNMRYFFEKHCFHFVASYVPENRSEFGEFLIYKKQMDVRNNDESFNSR
uniref:GNAT family N-acetyltransferase n=1 Tax=Candidatus Enterococcus willemsii TaxID=1857215 RepID=UPI00403F24D3